MLCRELGFQIATETYVFAPSGTCPIVKLRKLNNGALSRQGSAQKSRKTTKMLNIYRQ
jgi:hypothetical protein